MSDKPAETTTTKKPEEAKAAPKAPVADPAAPAEAAKAPETAPAEAGAAAGAEPQAEESVRKGLKPRLQALVARLPRGANLGRLVAGLLFLVVCVTGIHFLRDEVVVEVDEENLAETDLIDDFSPELAPAELALLGEGALENQDVEGASRFLEAARVRAERTAPDDVNLLVDVFEGLARVAELRGRPRVAELYRDYVRRKQAELGHSLPIFSAAERDFRAGNWKAARAGFSRFLLTRASLGVEGERYIDRAERRLTEIWERQFEEKSGGRESLTALSEPKEFFHDLR